MGKQILGFDFSLRFFDVQKLLGSASKPWEIESNDQHDLSATPCALTPFSRILILRRLFHKTIYQKPKSWVAAKIGGAQKIYKQYRNKVRWIQKKNTRKTHHEFIKQHLLSDFVFLQHFSFPHYWSQDLLPQKGLVGDPMYSRVCRMYCQHLDIVFSNLLCEISLRRRLSNIHLDAENKGSKIWTSSHQQRPQQGIAQQPLRAATSILMQKIRGPKSGPLNRAAASSHQHHPEHGIAQHHPLTSTVRSTVSRSNILTPAPSAPSAARYRVATSSHQHRPHRP